MTHMHLPDGILPVWLWVSGLLVAAALLAVSLSRLRTIDTKRKIPLLGTLAAAMLVFMSLEILPIAYHLNLSVATGILLGPSLGFVAAFIVNIMLALLGHGGITSIGLNTLLLGSEAVLGHSLFFLLRGVPVFWRAALATVLALVLVTLILIAIVGFSHVDAAAFLPEHGHGEETGGPHEGEAAAEGSTALSTFAVMVLSLGLVGWTIEALVTGAVIRFIARVKPDLLAHVLHQRPAGRGGGGAR